MENQSRCFLCANPPTWRVYAGPIPEAIRNTCRKHMAEAAESLCNVYGDDTRIGIRRTS